MNGTPGAPPPVSPGPAKQTTGVASPRRSRASLGVFAAVVLALGVVAAGAFVPYTFLKGDSAFYHKMVRSLLHDGGLEMSRWHPMSWYRGGLPHYREMDQAWSNLTLHPDGERYYPKHPWLISVFALPFYGLLGTPGVLVFNVLGLGLALLCAWQLARAAAGPGPATLALIPVVLAGLVTENTYTLSNDVFYTALVAAGLSALVARRLTVSALLLALATVAKPTNILWLPLPFVAALLDVRATWRAANHRHDAPWPVRASVHAMTRPALAVAAVAIPAMIVAWWMFGGPLKTGYHRIVVAHRGQIGLDSAVAAFTEPFWPGLRRQVVDAYQGLWPRGAILFVGALTGLAAVRRVGLVGLAPGAALLVYLLLHARYEFVWARFYLPCLVLTPLGLAALFADRAAAVQPRWPAGRQARWVVGSLALFWLVGVGAGRAQHVGVADEHTLADRIDEAEVIRRQGSANVPCDYMNPNTRHWECSRLEGRYWEGWGPDVRTTCRFDQWATPVGDEPSPAPDPGLLWLQPAESGAEKTIRWQALGPLDEMTLLLGLGKGSRGSDVQVEVLLGDVAVSLPERLRPGVLHRISLTDKVAPDGPNPLQIKVRAKTTGAWRQLCLGARLRGR